MAVVEDRFRSMMHRRARRGLWRVKGACRAAAHGHTRRAMHVPADRAAAPSPAPPASSPSPSSARGAAFVVVLAGVAAALHVGKVPPALEALRQALDLTLVQAGFLLSSTQLAGMALGVAFGAAADALGGKRSMGLGLLLLAAAGFAGSAAGGVALLLALRVVEGFGFLLVVLPAPGMLRRVVAPGKVNATLGVWGAYMPLGTALALLAGPAWVATLGWRTWWALMAAVSLAMAVWLQRAVPAPDAPALGAAQVPAAPGGVAHTAGASAAIDWAARLRATLGDAGPWLVALAFAAYSSQWLAVIGFLPTIYLHAGVSGTATGLLTALAAAVNMAGNIGAGRLLHRGAAPPRLLAAGFVAMALATLAAYAGPADAAWLPPWARYAGVLAFSLLGGMIPATLFALSVRLAPGEQTIATTVGWVQQWSAFGQFAGPPVVAFMASRAGGWHLTWVFSAACGAAGLVLTALIARRLK
jgi:MFS family permease